MPQNYFIEAKSSKKFWTNEGFTPSNEVRKTTDDPSKTANDGRLRCRVAVFLRVAGFFSPPHFLW
jgi:hypothetical protein